MITLYNYRHVKMHLCRQEIHLWSLYGGLRVLEHPNFYQKGATNYYVTEIMCLCFNCMSSVHFYFGATLELQEMIPSSASGGCTPQTQRLGSTSATTTGILAPPNFRRFHSLWSHEQGLIIKDCIAMHTN